MNNPTKINLNITERFNIDNQLRALYYSESRDVDIIYYSGGAGTGKSRLLCELANLYCLRFSGCRIAICRDTKLSLEQSTMKTYWDLMLEYNLKDKLEYNRTSGVITYPNGSEIRLLYLAKSLQDPEYSRIGSTEFTAIFIDELSGTIEERAFDILLPRVRYKLKDFNITPKVIIASNPSNSWVRKRFYLPFKEGKLNPRIKFMLSKTRDNPNLDESYYNQFEHLNEVDRQRLLEGDWENISEEADLFTMEELNNILCLPEKEGDKNIPYITVDVSAMGSDRSVVILWKGYHAIKIFSKKQTSTQELYTLITDWKNKYGVYVGNILVDSVGVGHGLADLLNGCVRFMANNKPNNEAFASIKDECVYHLAEVFKQGKLILPSDGRQYKDSLIIELNAHKKVLDSNKLKTTPKITIKSRIGMSPDLADAMIFRSYWDIQKNATFKPYYRQTN